LRGGGIGCKFSLHSFIVRAEFYALAPSPANKYRELSLLIATNRSPIYNNDG